MNSIKCPKCGKGAIDSYCDGGMMGLEEVIDMYRCRSCGHRWENQPKKHIVFYSGGLGSFLAGYYVAKYNPSLHIKFLFTDTLIEDEDLYRFLDEVVAYYKNVELVKITEGRTPWEVFKDVRLLGNSRQDPCSRILKREIAKKWVKTHYAPSDCFLYFGIDWTELHRCEAIERHWSPYVCRFPIIEHKITDRHRTALEILSRFKIEPPRLYKMGFHHNNCGGFCIKAGQGQFAVLLKQLPERYQEHERQEQAMREHLKKDVAIMKDRKGGNTTPLTMRHFRESVQAGCRQIDMLDIGGCGCFTE